MIEVTQADRDSAKILYPEIHEQIKVGCIDHWPEVQIFAAHRIQSTADLQAKLDKAVEALESARDQLWLLSKDPASNPFVLECNAALATIKGVKAWPAKSTTQ